MGWSDGCSIRPASHLVVIASTQFGANSLPPSSLLRFVLPFDSQMTHVAIELPEDIASRLGRQEELSRVALDSLAAQGYRSGKLTHAEVQRMLGFASRSETDAFLK